MMARAKPKPPKLRRKVERERRGKPRLTEQLASIQEARREASADVEAYLAWLKEEEIYLLERMEEEEKAAAKNEAREAESRRREQAAAKAAGMERLLEYADQNENFRAWLGKALNNSIPSSENALRAAFAEFGLSVPHSVHPNPGSSTASAAIAQTHETEAVGATSPPVSAQAAADRRTVDPEDER